MKDTLSWITLGFVLGCLIASVWFSFQFTAIQRRQIAILGILTDIHADANGHEEAHPTPSIPKELLK